jgi:hypothetical protein
MEWQNSPVSFHRLMVIVLRNLTGHECWVVMDDIKIFSYSVQEHVKWLANVFEGFRKASLQLQHEQCDFATNKVT